MSKLRDAAQQALEALETVLSDAYHRRFPECCGRPGIECCGNPNEAWTPEDNKIMDALSPVQRQLSDALRAALAEQPAEQEPVAWWHRKSNTFTSGNLVSNFAEWAPLYTAPQPAKPAEQEPVKFLANGTRFKMSFFQNEDGEGNTVPGTHVTCFEAFEEELDGRWVALVPAEDDCHLKYTAPQPRRRLTDEEIAVIYLDTAEETSSGGMRRMKAFARAIERAHGIGEHE